MRLIRTITYTLLTMITLVVISSCSTQKNTANSRAWKAFTARYNTYFNGHQAYIEGYKTKVDGNKDNYTDFLPLLPIGNKSSQSLGKGNFETCVTKMEKTIQLHSIKRKPEMKRGHKMTQKEKKYRERTEFNPFLKTAWMLMGYAQMQKGDFIEAASTFSYIENLYRTEPEIQNRARAMLALCYIQLSWYYDAEDLLRKIERDKIPEAARKEYNTAMADFHLKQKHWEEALPYLQREIPHMKYAIEKARGYFLLGQIYKTLGMKDEAYRAFQKCMRKSPSYEMKLNAMVQQTEVMPQGDNTKKIKKLTHLTKQTGNKKFLDQIYYAIGNIHLSTPDTAKALEAYEMGAAKVETKGLAYASLMLQMGDIYWARERFAKARTCYNNGVSIIDKEHERYADVSSRSKVLDKLAPPSETIFTQDSMRHLAQMPESERLAVIDKAIELEKKRQKELKAQRADSIARNRQNNGTTGNSNNTQGEDKKNSSNTANANDGAEWYFYNQQSVMQGKEQFSRIWGNRKNEDNWRRSNKSVLANINNTEIDYDQQDSIDNANNGAVADSLQSDTATTKGKKNKDKTLSSDEEKLTREYYLEQLPLTPEKMAESDTLLKKALYEAGVVEKDYLDNYSLAKRTLLRCLNDYPEFQPMDELLYHLYLMELHWGQKTDYEYYKGKLTNEFPESQYTLLINDPYYEENARFGKHIEDSLYAATYDAYKNSDYLTISANCAISAERFPKGENRPKFMFFDAMSKLRERDLRSFVDEMRQIVKDYPQDKISEIAGMMVKGIEAGRQPAGGGYDIMALLMQRDEQTGDETEQALKSDTLFTERQTDYTFILTYSRDSVDEGKLVYEISRFNFTNFLVRNFDIELTQDMGQMQMRIAGFYNFDEAHTYEQKLFQDSAFKSVAKSVEPLIISDHNLKLINMKYSWEQYKEFYQQYYVPSEVKEDLKFDNKPDNFIWDEYEDADDGTTDVNNDNNSDDDDDDDGYYGGDDDEDEDDGWY